MAFRFQKIEKVGFGDLEVEPKMTEEQRLRLHNLKIDPENLTEASDVLSQCFGAYAADVNNFMKKNMFFNDLVRLQMYLTQGPNAVADYDRRLDKAISEKMKESTDQETNDE